jgi:hypothetical protein
MMNEVIQAIHQELSLYVSTQPKAGDSPPPYSQGKDCPAA